MRFFLHTKRVLNGVYKHWLTFAFFFGFITDFILLNRIDDIFDNSMLFFYASLSTISMLLLYVGVAEKCPQFLVKKLKKFMPIVMQYAFGGLLSGMLIFYGRSGDLLASLPFLLIILTVILGNEFLEKRSDRLIYQLALYFIGLFSYVVLEVPVLTGKMGDVVFIFSGFIALVIVSLVVKVLYKIVPNFMSVNIGRVIVTIGFIYIGLNSLYFTNLIPPIPLSLTELKIVQEVEKIDGTGYVVKSEEQSWYSYFPLVKDVIHPMNDYVFCFARVYAPTRLTTDIYHRWEYKDENGEWKQYLRLRYGISGSNKNGYGGYTKISNFFDGTWRCSIETERGQVLGRTSIKIETIGAANKIKSQLR